MCSLIFLSFQLFAETQDPHFPFSKAHLLLPCSDFWFWNTAGTLRKSVGLDRPSHPSPPGPHAPPQPHHSEVSPGVKPSGSEHWDSACLSAPGAALGLLCQPPLDCRKRTAWCRPTESFLTEWSLIRKGRPLETNPMSEVHTCLWLSRASNAWVTADSPSTLFNVGRALTSGRSKKVQERHLLQSGKERKDGLGASLGINCWGRQHCGGTRNPPPTPQDLSRADLSFPNFT